jgi:hypothetical protein
MSDWNNSYEYTWCNLHTCLKSNKNKNENKITWSFKALIILIYIINKYFGFDDLTCLQLFYDKNNESNNRLVCALCNKSINENNKVNLKMITKPKEILFWLKEYKCDISGFKIETIDDNRFLCLKPSYINKILKKSTDQDIDEAFEQFELSFKIVSYLIYYFKGRMKGVIRIFGALNSTHIAFNSDELKGFKRELKNKLKYLNIDFYNTVYTDTNLLSNLSIYKIKDINLTNAMLRINKY